MANERILVLEDHAPLRDEICLALLDAGFQTQSAANGAEAIALAGESFDLLIADIFLPGRPAFRSSNRFARFTRTSPASSSPVTARGNSRSSVERRVCRFPGQAGCPGTTRRGGGECAGTGKTAPRERPFTRHRSSSSKPSHSFMGDFPLDELLNRIVVTAQRETQAQIVSLMLLDPGEKELRIAAAVGLPSHVVENECVPVGRGIAGRVAQTGEPLMLTESAPLDPEIRELMKKPEVLSSLSLPLRVRNQVIGVLNLSRMHGDEPFRTADLEIATVFAGQAAMAIAQARLFGQLKMLNQISQRLASAVDLSEAITTIIEAPSKLVDARETILWLIEGTIQPTLMGSLGLQNQIQILPREQIITKFKASDETDWVTVPLQHGERILGGLHVWLPSPAVASEERLGALRTLAHTASAVIESLSLHERELFAFREVDDAIRAGSEPATTLEPFAERDDRFVRSRRRCHFPRNAVSNQVEELVTIRFDGSEDLAQTIIREGHAQPIFYVMPATLDPSTSSRSFIGAPMIIGSHVGGAVVLSRSVQSGRFTKRHVELLSTLASTAALAVRNTQLYRVRRKRQSSKSAHGFREIHDGLAQDLSYLVLKIGVAQKFASQAKDRDLRKELDEISNQLRRDLREVRHDFRAASARHRNRRLFARPAQVHKRVWADA